jgi:tRNA-uridine 2-sulfurtransferase
MSGGVDSSVSAYLLREAGYNVIGLFMRSGAAEESACATGSGGMLPIVKSESHKQGCCSASDAADARRVADQLDIPFHALNFQEAFGRIKDYFVDEYLSGRTPNPCVMCNNWLKFGKLWDFAQQVGAEYIASGHYARVVPMEAGVGSLSHAGRGPVSQAGDVRPEKDSLPHDGRLKAGLRTALVRGVDPDKDQSYVLFGLNRDLLPHVLFPVGTYDKHEIRDIARKAGLRVAEKPDSQEICFVPDQDYAGFIRRYHGEFDTAGELVDTAGNTVGRHEGYERFTIGQRRGLGVGFGAPRYVVAVHADTKQVVIGTREDLARHELEADRLNWLADGLPQKFSCTAKIRYLHTPAAAEVELLEGDTMRVRFAEPQFGVAPGQAVVLYDGDRVLGGGWIRS